MKNDDWQVVIEQDGRSGTVAYLEPGEELKFWWEFGGGEAVALISVGSEEEWRAQFPRALPRRALIIGRVMAEVLRQQASSCTATFDDDCWITIRRTTGSANEFRSPREHSAPTDSASQRTHAANVKFYNRWRELRLVALGFVVLLSAGFAAFWVLRSALFATKTTGGPSGASLRAADKIVTLIIRQEPYVPSLHRNPENDRYSIGILVHDASTGEREFFEIGRGRTGSSLPRCKLVAIRGSRVWADTPETAMLDLSTGLVTNADALANTPSLAPPKQQRTLADFGSEGNEIALNLASGGQVQGRGWLGVYTAKQAKYMASAAKMALSAADYQKTNEPCRIYVGELTERRSPRLLGSLHPVGAQPCFAGAFVRAERGGGLAELEGGGHLLVFKSQPNRAGSYVAASVNAAGSIQWSTDTGIGELKGTLTDARRPALIGLRPRVKDKVPEPVLVFIDSKTGRLATHSLWVVD